MIPALHPAFSTGSGFTSGVMFSLSSSKILFKINVKDFAYKLIRICIIYVTTVYIIVFKFKKQVDNAFYYFNFCFDFQVSFEEFRNGFVNVLANAIDCLSEITDEDQSEWSELENILGKSSIGSHSRVLCTIVMI